MNTWHGIALKYIGNDCPGRKDYNFDTLDYLTVSGDYDERVFKSAFNARESSYLRCGMPRNEELWLADENKMVAMRKKLGIPESKKVILYAPTWRESTDGGKSYAIGWDDSWGSPMTVSAEGSKSSGTVRSYGLDCSGFVAWSYYNGLGGKDAGIGNHTTTQWNASEMVDSQSAKPGDLVFYHPASAGDDNHVGIVVGVNDNGSLLVVHCSSSQNGVMTGEAWSAGFQYVRSPLGLE